MRVATAAAGVGTAAGLIAMCGCAVSTNPKIDASVIDPGMARRTAGNAAQLPSRAPTATPSSVVTPTPQTPRGHGVAYLSVPSIGIDRVKIVYYEGEPDDDRGTGINDDGLVGAPRSRTYGVAPGQIGNLLLTGHRTSAGAPMQDVPKLDAGDDVYIDQGMYRFVYRVNHDYWINFRDRSSRLLQESPVPGSPGKRATRAAVVLSTCATPEDHAAGDYWSDEHSNPTHRIAVAGYLVRTIARP